MCAFLWGALRTAAYRAGYEGEDSHGSRPSDGVAGPPGKDDGDDGARRGGLAQDGHVVDRAVQGDPERGDAVDEGRREGRVAREDRGRVREPERRGEKGREERAGEGDAESEREERGEGEGGEGESERSGRGQDAGRARSEAAAPGERGDRGESAGHGKFAKVYEATVREGDERQGREEEGERDRAPRREDKRDAETDVPTDEYRRKNERETRERLDHDLQRDTGRGSCLSVACCCVEQEAEEGFF